MTVARELVDAILGKKHLVAEEKLASIMVGALRKRLTEQKMIAAAHIGLHQDAIDEARKYQNISDKHWERMPNKGPRGKQVPTYAADMNRLGKFMQTTQSKWKCPHCGDTPMLGAQRGVDPNGDRLPLSTFQHGKPDTMVSHIEQNCQKCGALLQLGHLNKEETLDEMRSNIIKQGRVRVIRVRIRSGKIQRRKKQSAVGGYRLAAGRLHRMTPIEKRRRKLGARRAKIKRRGKMQRINIKRARSMRRRRSLGL